MKHQKDCYSCRYFQWYNHATGNIHCKKRIVQQFGFGDILTCMYWED